jgi:hypothetical protein
MLNDRQGWAVGWEKENTVRKLWCILFHWQTWCEGWRIEWGDSRGRYRTCSKCGRIVYMDD